MDASIRERVGKEFAAGPVLPLVDQAIASASAGSFDVNISDRFYKDEAAFRARFSALSSVNIHKACCRRSIVRKTQDLWDKA